MFATNPTLTAGFLSMRTQSRESYWLTFIAVAVIAQFFLVSPAQAQVPEEDVFPGCYGAIEHLDRDWSKVETPRKADDPIVILGPPTENGTPGTTRIRNVSAAGFEARFSPWDERVDRVESTSVSYLEVEVGLNIMPTCGKLGAFDDVVNMAGRVSIEAVNRWHRIEFPKALSQAPYLFLTIETSNETTPLTTRARNVGNDGFEVMIAGPRVGSERLAYLAMFRRIDPPSGYVTIGGEEVPYRLRTVRVGSKWTRVGSVELRLEAPERAREEIVENVDVLFLGDQVFAQIVSDHSEGPVGVRMTRARK